MSDPLDLATYFANRGQADAANKAAKRKPRRATAVEWHGYDADLGRHLIKLPGMSEPKPIGSTLTSGGLTVGQSVDGAPKGQAIAVDGLPGRRPQPVQEGRRSTQVKWAIAWITGRVTGRVGSDFTNADITATAWYLASGMQEAIAVWSDTTPILATPERGFVLYDLTGFGTDSPDDPDSGEAPARVLIHLLRNGSTVLEIGATYYQFRGTDDDPLPGRFKQSSFRYLINRNAAIEPLPGFDSEFIDGEDSELPNQTTGVQYSEYFVNNHLAYRPGISDTERQFGSSVLSPRIYFKNAMRRFPSTPDTPLPNPPVDYWWRAPSAGNETVSGSKSFAARIKVADETTDLFDSVSTTAIGNLPAPGETTFGSDSFNPLFPLVRDGEGNLEVVRLSDRREQGIEGNDGIPKTVVARQPFTQTSQPAFFETFSDRSSNSQFDNALQFLYFGDLRAYSAVFKVQVR